MTSKRTIEKGIEQLDEQALEALPPEYRLKLTMEAEAEGRDEWVEKLVDTVPQRRYRMSDAKWSEGVERAQLLSWEAIYKLHTAYWQFNYKRVLGMWIEEQYRIHGDDVFEWWDYVDEDDAPDFEGLAREAATHFYVNYHAYKRFVEEVLGVEMSVLLSFTPSQNDAAVIESAERLPEQGWVHVGQTVETADGVDDYTYEMGTVEIGGEEHQVDDAVDVLYDRLCDEWTNA